MSVISQSMCISVPSMEKFLLNSFYCVCGPEAQRNPEDALRAMARLAKFGLKAVARVREGELANNAKKEQCNSYSRQKERLSVIM